MGEWRMVVLVGMGRCQMRPLLALNEVVGDVGVLVLVHLSVMAVLLCGYHTSCWLAAAWAFSSSPTPHRSPITW
jgi:hypothetical protein